MDAWLLHGPHSHLQENEPLNPAPDPDETRRRIPWVPGCQCVLPSCHLPVVGRSLHAAPHYDSVRIAARKRSPIVVARVAGNLVARLRADEGTVWPDSSRVVLRTGTRKLGYYYYFKSSMAFVQQRIKSPQSSRGTPDRPMPSWCYTTTMYVCTLLPDANQPSTLGQWRGQMAG